jgi:hypothetical protein
MLSVAIDSVVDYLFVTDESYNGRRNIEEADLTNFTWERGPFERCAGCGENTIGLLSAGGHVLTKRCTNCRRTVQIDLPKLSKKAVYLDQFMFSLIYNVKNDGNLPKGHEAFAKEVYLLLRRCVLLQQIILPHSDIHHDETTVFHSPIDLRGLYQFFGGDVSLRDRRHVELGQNIKFAEAFFDGKEPEVIFDLDEVADSDRDNWLPHMHVGVRADYSQFADNIRKVRGEAHEEMKRLAQTWADTKPSFRDVLESELVSIGPNKKEAIARWFVRAIYPDPSDPLALLKGSVEPIHLEYRALCRLLSERGVEENKQLSHVIEFWQWEKNRDIPHYRISAYLFAVVARRVAMGEKKIIDRGLINDVSTIATYAPYVDAMFIDKRCAAILAEEPLATDLEYKAQIFSLSNTDGFLQYLHEIEAGAPEDVREFAFQIYGIK